MQYTKKVLKNGMRIITIPMKSNPTVTTLVFVEAGSKYENKANNGISHFLEHMCFKGTKRRPQASNISEELDTIGSQYNAFTSFEQTGYWVKSEYKNFDKVLDVVSDMYVNPLFLESEIEKEKGVIIEEMNSRADSPRSVASKKFFDLLYGDQPAGWDIIGLKENIQKMTRTDFIDYRNKHYVASATCVIVAGKINEKEVIKKVTKAFKDIGTWKKEGKSRVTESQRAPQATIFYKDTDQTHIIIGVRSFSIYNEYNPILLVIEGILSGGMSSRLFKKLRDEMGICYYVRADNYPLTDHGMFSVGAGVDSKRVKEAITAILDELKKLKTELVNKDELNKVKQLLTSNIQLGLESSDSVASFLGEQEILRETLKTPEDIIKEIKAVTPEQIKFIAERIFKNEALNLALVGKFKEKEEFLKVLKF